MGTTAENAGIPPYAQDDGTFSGPRLEEDLELPERISTVETTPCLHWQQMASLCWTMFHLAWCPEPFQLFFFRIMADVADGKPVVCLIIPSVRK
jgi:hypothetical protein